MLKSIPPITRNLLFINVIVFMVQLVLESQGDEILTRLFGLHFFMAPEFRLWQFVTYLFLHGSWSHVLFNMFSLWMFGRIIEQTMGQRQFLIYYLICGVGAGLCQELWQLGEYFYLGLNQYSMVDTGSGTLPMADFLNAWVTIGASVSCYCLLLAFGVTFPNERIMLLIPPIPMKAKYFVIGYAAIELYSAFASSGNVAHFAHLGGMLFGWFYFVHCRRKMQRQSRQSGWTNYQRGYGPSQPQSTTFFGRIRAAVQGFGQQLEAWVRNLTGRQSHSRPASGEPKGGYSNIDHEYNARRRANQEKIDAILDKVRRSGYASLTEEEKQELFKNSQR